MIGFENIEHQLTENFYNNKLHHAIILSGKKGIGKATFLTEFCRKILNNFDEINPNIMIVTKEDDKKSISVNAIRKQMNFLYQSSASAPYKFLIIDSACEMTNQAANSLLKILEEPKNGTFIFLITHNLSKVLATIRSRSLIVKIPEISIEQFCEIMQNNNKNYPKDELNFLSKITDNAPASALAYGDDFIGFYKNFLMSLNNKNLSDEIIKKLSDKKFHWSVLENCILFFNAQFIKFVNNYSTEFYFDEDVVMQNLSTKFSSRQIIEFYDNCLKNLDNCERYNLDKKTNFINIFNQINYV